MFFVLGLKKKIVQYKFSCFWTNYRIFRSAVSNPEVFILCSHCRGAFEQGTHPGSDPASDRCSESPPPGVCTVTVTL